MALIGKTNPNARPLRREATDAERRLWRHLRNRNIAGFKFRRQVTIGPFIADFTCVECKLVVEADGGQHEESIDAQRTAYLESLGWRVIRFWNDDILLRTDAVLGVILDTCLQRQKTGEPLTLPSPASGRGRKVTTPLHLARLRERSTRRKASG